MAPHEITCTKCNGTGKAPLPPALAATLDAVPAEWIGTRRIRKALAKRKADFTIGTGTLAMRLQRLVDANLVEKRQSQDDPRFNDYRRIG